ncbi:MAG TPA: hypothetical protein EYG94_00245 [Campylobacterales bacterium]|nr:hypothetical protein [Campylobacterales bacterium]
MNEQIKKSMLLGILLVLSLTNYTLAAPALPVSSQSSEEIKNEKVEIVQEIKIEIQSSSSKSNPKLKEGNACSDENLEEVQGELFVDNIPMAKTIPCDKVDCNGLSAAKMYKDNYKKLQTAKTIACGK